MTERLLGIAEVLSQTSLGRRTLYEHVKAGKFPKPVRISERRRAWREKDVQAWIRSKLESRE